MKYTPFEIKVEIEIKEKISIVLHRFDQKPHQRYN